ncbi:hypothetical protein PsYK624_095610 [Phanerochaete sordida]|uniref:Uncharacterized protein n=1 Tax=Phanerochaete sordida TaxID=48140 RepID=A0A9P3LGS8_9APHY|nr:hypothetical protein PsYK624_095610 [Phanerochaete sordida]
MRNATDAGLAPTAAWTRASRYGGAAPEPQCRRPTDPSSPPPKLRCIFRPEACSNGRVCWSAAGTAQVDRRPAKTPPGGIIGIDARWFGFKLRGR